MAFADSSRRCPACLTNWPNTDDDGHVYNRCPECDEKTSVFYSAPPIDRAEARRRRLTVEFEDWAAANAPPAPESAASSVGPLSPAALEAVSQPLELIEVEEPE